MTQFQSQGEVNFIPASEFPKEFLESFTEEEKSPVLAHGETGNAHELAGRAWSAKRSPQFPGFILIMVRQPTPVKHPEHRDLTIERDMVVSVSHEYDPFKGVLQRVAD